MDRDVRVDLLAGDELELVDDALVVRVGHREEDAIAAHEDRQDAVRLGHLARHDVEVVEHDRHLRQVDPGHAVLLGQSAERIDLVDRPLAHEDRGERLRRREALLGLERGFELLLRIRAFAGAGSCRAAAFRRWTSRRGRRLHSQSTPTYAPLSMALSILCAHSA